MKENEEIFLEYLCAIADQDIKQLGRLIHLDAIFEFPYALPSKPLTVVGKNKILESLSHRKFKSTLHEPIYIESTKSGDVYAEIISEETFHKTGKTYQQHLICKAKVEEGKIKCYKEFFNPITRLQGLLDLDNDNIIILND